VIIVERLYIKRNVLLKTNIIIIVPRSVFTNISVGFTVEKTTQIGEVDTIKIVIYVKNHSGFSLVERRNTDFALLSVKECGGQRN